jgi:hypothetical protein
VISASAWRFLHKGFPIPLPCPDSPDMLFLLRCTTHHRKNPKSGTIFLNCSNFRKSLFSMFFLDKNSQLFRFAKWYYPYPPNSPKGYISFRIATLTKQKYTSILFYKSRKPLIYWAFLDRRQTVSTCGESYFLYYN